MPVSLDLIRCAARAIAPYIYRSPCVHSETLSRLCGAEVWSKLDHLQATGSFKERGACNKLLSLDAKEAQRGVIAVSAGNHALGLARHGKLLNIPVCVVMPRFAPMVKIHNCRLLDAEVIIHGDDFACAKEHALALAKDRGTTFIPAFDDDEIICGQGTIGLEILEDLPEVDAIFVPIGGGGLAAGLATAVKSQRPQCRIIGVEPEHAPGMHASLIKGEPCLVATQPTLADGLAAAQVGQRCFEICQQLLDEVLLVDESLIAQAIVRLLEHEKMVVEGAGAASLAGALQRPLLMRHGLLGKRIALVICGGNIDVSMLNRVIERAFAADGRMCRIGVSLRDRPGSLVHLCAVIAGAEGNVKEITHDRTFGPMDPNWVSSLLTIETRDHEHIKAIHRALDQAGILFSTS
ncbi:MAG: threonine ammonia-lyase [Planctomycetota bacterium]|nr:MAG: threonine ammonia-lyase [Planctomycetota bacterium]